MSFVAHVIELAALVTLVQSAGTLSALDVARRAPECRAPGRLLRVISAWSHRRGSRPAAGWKFAQDSTKQPTAGLFGDRGAARSNGHPVPAPLNHLEP
jgi:hypothetical protein